jgi:anti-sigma B factor antagonist
MTRLAQQQTEVSSEVVGGHTEVITLDGEFDLAKAPEVEQRLVDALGPEQADVLVDLRGVRFLDSTMLHALVRGKTQASERGAQFGLIRPHARVWRVFVLTGFSERFPSYSSIREALAEG